VNNVGYFPNRPIEELDLATWRRTMATALFEREILLAWDEKEEVGPFLSAYRRTWSAWPFLA
jgi:hypothetical protein